MTTNANAKGASATSTATGSFVAQGGSHNRPEAPKNSPGCATVDAYSRTSNIAADAGLPELRIIPEQCLFCNLVSADFGSNVSHMHKKHGLFIPIDIEDGSLILAVDLETLVRYLHLVVFEYNECLCCHTQKQTTEAVQQHMMGKGHCRIDLVGEESEFRDFYEEVDDGSAVSDDDMDQGEAFARSDNDETGTTPKSQARTREPSFMNKSKTLRLSSGKVLAHRSTPSPRHHRPLTASQGLAHLDSSDTAGGTSPSTSSPTQSSSGVARDHLPPNTATSTRALASTERPTGSKDRSNFSMALSRLSVNDRAALAHLPTPQQRAIVLTQFKQQDKARNYERRYRESWTSLLMKRSMAGEWPVFLADLDEHIAHLGMVQVCRSAGLSGSVTEWTKEKITWVLSGKTAGFEVESGRSRRRTRNILRDK
ncbi:hypothetical protein SLS53_005684 [Cytospora paraplurivora]|uniref:ZN622/Rei1/Reh1 zinc finger C2H2-type domain-containing protein n=1 Tax=Cytospora paraplurivora TaxID=2898453 RepID=A0AAN9U544_9PEZI